MCVTRVLVVVVVDVVMVTQQIGNSHSRASFWGTYRRLKEDEDWPAFVKGFYTSYLASLLEDGVRRAVTSRIESVSWMSPYAKYLVPVLPVLIGHWVLYPLKLIRTRLIQQIKHQKYAGEWNCFVKMRQEEGTLAMWSGLAIDTVRLALQLFFSHWAHRFLTVPIFKRIPSYLALFAALPSEIAIASITYPLSTIVTKLQAQAANIPKHMQPDIQAHGTLECIKKVHHSKHGIRALWNGYFGFCFRTVAQMTAITCLTQAFWRAGYLQSRLAK